MGLLLLIILCIVVPPIGAIVLTYFILSCIWHFAKWVWNYDSDEAKAEENYWLERKLELTKLYQPDGIWEIQGDRVACVGTKIKPEPLPDHIKADVHWLN